MRLFCRPTILDDRQEWLAVADAHRVDVVNKFVEGGGGGDPQHRILHRKK